MTGWAAPPPRSAAEAAPLELLHPGGLDLTRRAVEACAFRPGERVIDVGCGSGAGVRFLDQAQGLRAAGVDLRWPALLEGRKTFPGLSLVCAQAERLPFGDETWDGMLAECSFSTFHDPGCMLAECRRVLARGGRLAISDLYWRFPEQGNGPTAPVPFLSGLWVQQEWLNRLEDNGLRVCLWEDHTPALKALAAQAMFAGRSIASLWGCCPPENGAALSTAVAQLRPGYFLLIAQKVGE